jgi:HEAT repeat protein/CheY-like chemotaxis protein
MPDFADRSPRILIIDDDPNWIKFIGSSAEALGHTWETASNLEEVEIAIKETEETGASFFAVTIDEKVMKSHGGTDLLRYIRSKCPHIACIVVSGSPADDAYQLLRLQVDPGLDAYISKSRFDTDTFAEAVASAIRHARSRENQEARMIESNNMALYEALFLFRNAMLSFILERLHSVYGSGWWETGVASALGEEAFHRLETQYERELAPAKAPSSEFYQMLGIVDFLPIIQRNWRKCFVSTFEEQNRNTVEVWFSQIIKVRNAVVHSRPVSDEDTWRALDTMSRLVRPVDNEVADRIIQIGKGLYTPETETNAVAQMDELIDALQHKDSSVRRVAVEALGKLRGARAIVALEAALDDDAASVRRAAAQALGDIEDPQVVFPLVWALDDKTVTVRKTAAKALVEIGDTQAVHLLIDLYPHVSEQWQTYVLVKLIPRLVEMGYPHQALTATQAVESGRRRAEILAVLASHLPEPLFGEALFIAKKIMSERYRVEALAALAPYLAGEALEEGLAVALAIENGWYRAQALVALAPHLAGEALEHGLSAALAIEEERSRAEALAALAPHLAGEALERRLAVAEALGRIGDERAVEPLLGLLEDRDRDVRQAAVAALGRIGDERALEPLLGLLEDRDRDVRQAAAEALGRIGDEVSVEQASGLIISDQATSGMVPSIEAFAVAQIEDHHTDTPIVANKEYILLAGILSSIPAFFAGEPVQLPDVDVVEIDIVVRAVGVKVLPHWVQRTRYFRGRDSGLLEFRLVPREVGQKRIQVEFYYQRHWLAQLKFEVEVAEAQQLIPA